MNNQAATSPGQPRIIYISSQDLEWPCSRDLVHVDEKYNETRKLCKDIIADLRCLQRAYIFKPKHFDRTTVCEHLKEILDEFHLLRKAPSRFASCSEFELFVKTVGTLAAETARIINATKQRDQLRLKVQNETLEKISQDAHPRYLPDLPPWSQFLVPDAPSLPVAHFLPPFATRPPTDISFPEYRHIKTTSVQALPQAATAILGKWAREFQKIIEVFQERYPRAREFAGPLQRKLVPFRQMIRTPDGLKTEALRIHNLGNNHYARAIEYSKAVGPEEKESLGRFLGRLERKDEPSPTAANSCYVVRKWLLERAET